MIQSPLNNVIVRMKKKYLRGFTDVMKLAAIQNNSSVEMADLVNIVGEVVSVPLDISKKREYKGFSTVSIQVGDTAIFSPYIVYEFKSTAPEEEPIHKNSFWYREELWVCDITRLFAVIRDGEILMLNGYVMIVDIEKPPMIHLPQNIKRKLKTATGVVSEIGEPLSHLPKPNVKKGDTIYFNPSIIQLYAINGKPFGIISQSQILGKQTYVSG